MDPAVIGLIEPAVVFATMLGVAFGVKFLVWGKGPIRRRENPKALEALERRIGELEEHVSQQLSELGAGHAEQIADLEERLEFAERLLTRQRLEQPPSLNKPDASNPT